jgi:small GTP-binding protein
MKDSDSTIGTYKVVLLGEAGVGKTSIIAQFMDQTFQSDLQSSTGGTYSSKSFTYGDNKVITLEIWDTAGQERYRSLTTMFYKDANAACLIYDITRKITFEEIQTYWVEQIRENAPQDIMLILVGNKSDLTDKEEVDEGIARDYAREIGAIYCTTSAKDYIQTCDLFKQIVMKHTGAKNVEIKKDEDESIHTYSEDESVRNGPMKLSKSKTGDKKGSKKKCC